MADAVIEARQGETADDEAALAEAANATEEAEPTDIEEIADKAEE